MSSFIDRHKDAHDDMTAAVDKKSRPREKTEDDDNSNYVTTMFPPRKKARTVETNDSAVGSMTAALTTWLASLGNLVKSTLGLESAPTVTSPASMASTATATTTTDDKAADVPKTTAAPKKTATTTTPKKSSTTTTPKKAATASTTPKSMTATSTTPKKPRQPRRCVICLKRFGDEQMARDCPGKQNRKRCIHATDSDTTPTK